MIAGRPLSAWTGLVATVAAAIVVTAQAAGIAVNLEMLAADVAVASFVLALIANKSVNGSLLGRAK
jgi:hypothetical protein